MTQYLAFSIDSQLMEEINRLRHKDSIWEGDSKNKKEIQMDPKMTKGNISLSRKSLL